MLKIFLSILLFFLHSSMAKTLETNLCDYYETKDYLSYTLAQELNETVEQLELKTWSKDKKSFNSFNYANNAYWAKIKIKNLANRSQTYYLKAENQFTYKIDYYLVKNNQTVRHIADGTISKNPHRAFNANHMLFPLTMEKNDEVEVYFKIRNYNKVNINFTLVTKEYLLDYYQTYNIIEGIFFGGMLLMMFYNLFLYALFRIRAYLYYVGYVFWLNVYFIGLFGFSQRYFESYTFIFYLSSVAFFIFLTLFVQSILGLKKKLPKIHKILNLFIVYFIVSTLINTYVLEMNQFLYAQLLFNLFFFMLFIFAMVIIGATCYLAYVKKDPIAKFYSVIWSLLAIIGMFLPFQYLNIITLDIPADYVFQFLTLIEVLFFSFILAYNLNLKEREKKKQEHLLIQQNKLASMGELIGMIAHQWRQPLSEINGIILNMDIDQYNQQLHPHKFTNYLDNIENITTHMSATINDFMDYFQHTQKIETFSLSTLINGSLNLIKNTNKKNIPIQYIKHPQILLRSYQSQLIQTLLIVINNALDACILNNEPNDSEIIIDVKSFSDYVLIRIQDNGGGISPEIMDKIYDPYFTTKHKSKGTGLGLYILKMIVEQTLQGKVDIQSTQRTTQCDIYIPKK